MKFLSISSFLLLFAACHAQPIRLIVRGDDMGYSHAGNQALIKCHKEGIETSIEVIVASPWFPEAVKLLAADSSVDVGIHLALTSEWSNVKWRPLTDCASLKDADGYFYPMVFPNKNYPGQSISEHAWNIAEIEKEFRAQIELALRKIPRISHISSHMGCTDLSDSVAAMTRRLAKEYKIDIDLKTYNVTEVGYKGPSGTSAQKISSFIAMLNDLTPGHTYHFLDHPGLDSPELRAIYHIGYEGVAVDRQGVTDTWTNKEVKEVIRKKEIKLISYKELLSQ
jgi:chitin disaccharide deacetylase